MFFSEGTKIINSDLSIALCTCEGSFFLPAQLESLAGQSVLPGEVVVCDDASTDGSVDIVEEFAKKVPFQVQIVVNEARMGAVKNFEQAISLCKGKYIALCDQDDTWYENRLEMALQCMIEAEKDSGAKTPVLVHSDLAVIDGSGKQVAPSYMKARRIKHKGDKVLNNLVAQNFVTGNTVLFNSALKKLALPIPDEAFMHDWWLALVAAAAGQIEFIEQPTVYYRQHQANVIGFGKLYSGRNLKRAIDLGKLESDLAAELSQAFALQKRLEALSINEHKWLESFLQEVKMGKGIAALQAALRSGVRKQGLLRRMIYYLLLLKGDYRLTVEAEKRMEQPGEEDLKE